MTAQPNPPPLFSENSKPNGLGYYGAPTRPLYWSVWRELWENCSILYSAAHRRRHPGDCSFGFSAIGLAERRRAVLLLDPIKQRAIEQPYDLAAMMMIFTVFVVGVFYCLDALYGEGDATASVLFWKSLPVSDLNHRSLQGHHSAGGFATDLLPPSHLFACNWP